ncbi:MAG TPA: hypothetical protein VFN67_30065 [Polyangiales bacterium]|nr:hypothetical protein [Polyangiales bacterium]
MTHSLAPPRRCPRRLRQVDPLEFCKGSGIAISSQRADAARTDCEARIERRVVAYGLCACEELRTDPASFSIDSFDSSRGAYSAGQTGGNVGVSSASLQLADNTQILGSLWVAGELPALPDGRRLL